MKSALQKIKHALKTLHNDDKGANMVEYILMIAAVSIPLLFVLIWFWKDLSKWFGDIWESLKSDPDGTDPGTL